MRKTVLLILCVALIAAIGCQTTTKIVTDPTKVNMDQRTKELQDLRFGMFICWSFSTFSGKEWTRGVTNLDLFAATDCDTDQWAKTAKEAGMGYILFLTKHHDGLCLWDTKTTDRKVTKTELGRDVLKELQKSCDKYGIKLALYFSEGEWASPDFPDKRARKNGGGYDPELKKAQLKELLTQYGPIEYIWFDHAVGDGGLSHEETIKFCKNLQPGCFIGFNHGNQEGADIRLGEMGRPGPLADQSAAGPHMKDGAAKSYRLAEFTYPILPSHQGGAMWFYSLPKHDNLCRTAEQIYQDYLGAKKYGNVFALDVGPDYNGRIRKIDILTLQKVGRMIRGKEKELPQPKPVSEARVKQLQDLRFGMFICWSLSSFSGYEWTPGVEDINFFNPTGFDPDQWCRVAKEAGMGYILFLTKHHDGFCLWNTGTTDRNVSNTKALKGVDALAEVKKACDKHGLKLALYFSEGDWSWTPENKGIHQSAARPDIKKAQLRELLTNYGPIEFLWMDHAVNDGGLSHEETVKFCKSIQPDCFVGFNAGAKAGDLALRERGQAGPIGGKEVFKTSHLNGTQEDHIAYRVAEFTYPILEGQGRINVRGAQWFYSLPENDNVCATAEKIYKDYLGAKEFSNIFSLDVGPDRNGRIRKIDEQTLNKVGQYIRGEIKLAEPKPGYKVSASSVWQNDQQYQAANAFDGNKATRWGAAENSRAGWLEADIGVEKEIKRVVVDEAGFDRTQKYEIQAKVNGAWKTVASGTTIGSPKEIKFEAPVKAPVFRLNIIEASEVPTISEFELFE